LGDLISAAKIIQDRKKNLNIKFLIYGDGTERQMLENRCLSEKIGNVIFKGHVPGQFIPYILSKSDLNIIIVRQTELMRFGSSLNKLFDYMASGKPIVSNLRVNYDLLKRYNCGITTKDESGQALAAAVEQICELPKSVYLNMCENAKKAAKDYDYKLLTNKLRDIISSMGA
jgi:glycosyltransferase involved in cell wall biosynthesis